MDEISTTNIKLDFRGENIKNKVEKWKFPILALDFEAYHFKKDYCQYDHLSNCHSKPFLIGTTLIQSLDNLKHKLLDELINYRYFLNWKVNNKYLFPFKSFANYLNKIVKNLNIKTFLVLGKELEWKILEIMAKKKFLKFNLLKIDLIDIYDLYQSEENLIVSDLEQNVIKIKKPEYVLKDDQLYNILLREVNNDKKYWDDLWRSLDAFYTYDIKHMYKNLKAFQNQHQQKIIDKNYNDLIKMTNLLKIFVNGYL